MINTTDYISKKKELHFYIQNLIFLDSTNSIPSTPYDRYLRNKLTSSSYKMTDFIVILKSNTFMMMYNMIESTVKNLILSLYDEINSSRLTYADLIEKLKELWQKYAFINLDSGNVRTDTFKEKAHEMINSIIYSESILFKETDFKLSGNADFDSINTAMQNHGINFETSNIGIYKDELRNIKNIRNNLAHGSTSFIESARDTTVSDIEHVNEHVEIFLDQLIKDTKKYIQYKRYKQPSNKR